MSAKCIIVNVQIEMHIFKWNQGYRMHCMLSCLLCPRACSSSLGSFNHVELFKWPDISPSDSTNDRSLGRGYLTDQ